MAAFIVAVTGASGALYARAMMKALNDLNHHVFLTITEPGRRVIREELSWDLPALDDPAFTEAVKSRVGWRRHSRLEYFDYRDIGARIASGSVKTEKQLHKMD